MGPCLLRPTVPVKPDTKQPDLFHIASSQSDSRTRDESNSGSGLWKVSARLTAGSSMFAGGRSRRRRNPGYFSLAGSVYTFPTVSASAATGPALRYEPVWLPYDGHF